MKPDLLENAKAAAICFFFAPIMWIAGAYVIAMVATVAGLLVLSLPPIIAEHINVGRSPRFFWLIGVSTVAIATTLVVLFGLHQYIECLRYTGTFSLAGFTCN